MTFFDRGWFRKVSVVAAPAFLFLLFLYLVLPQARKYYVRSSLNLTAVENENVIVYASDQATARQVQKTFTRFRTVFYQQFPLDLEPTREQLRIHVFESNDQLSDYYSRKTEERLPHNSAYYDREDRSIALVRSKKAAMEHVIKHEAIHHFLNQASTVSTTGISTWLSEGMASLYQYYRVSLTSDDKPSWHMSPSAERVVLLPYAASLQLKEPLESFLRVDGKDFQRADNRAYYQQARLLVLYLMRQHSEAFWSYLRYELDNGPDQGAAFKRIVGEPQEIEEDLKEWVRKRIKKMEGETR